MLPRCSEHCSAGCSQEAREESDARRVGQNPGKEREEQRALLLCKEYRVHPCGEGEEYEEQEVQRHGRLLFMVRKLRSPDLQSHGQGPGDASRQQGMPLSRAELSRLFSRHACDSSCDARRRVQLPPPFRCCNHAICTNVRFCSSHCSVCMRARAGTAARRARPTAHPAMQPRPGAPCRAISAPPPPPAWLVTEQPQRRGGGRTRPGCPRFVRLSARPGPAFRPRTLCPVPSMRPLCVRRVGGWACASVLLPLAA